jgi:hypothetical protein
MAAAYLQKGNVSAYLTMTSRAYRMDALSSLVGDGYFDPEKVEDRIAYWEHARAVWVDAEQPEDDERWTRLMTDMPEPWRMTSDEDRRDMRAFPYMVPVYKGMRVPHSATDEEIYAMSEVGWSWTISKSVAHYFGCRFESDSTRGIVVRAGAPRDDITAYVTDRGEEEVLIRPGTVRATSWKHTSLAYIHRVPNTENNADVS